MQPLKDQLAELESLEVPLTRRPDFDEFWNEVLHDVREAPLEVSYETVDYPIRGMEVRDLTFAALDGTRVHAWMLLPPEAKDGPVPCLMHYHGMTGSRGYPSDFLLWVAMGAAVASIDFRMQGGPTNSETGFGGGAGNVYFSTLGLPGRKTWYRYWLVTDALRMLLVALEEPATDSDRIAVCGGSQGGGMCLTVAALMPEHVALAMPNVPSACRLEKRVFSRAGGYGQIAEYLRRHPDEVEEVCATLSYYDNMNLADRIRCPMLVSLGLKDPVCPPECTYAALNRVGAPMEVCAYPFGEHDGGGAVHDQKMLRYFREHMLDD